MNCRVSGLKKKLNGRPPTSNGPPLHGRDNPDQGGVSNVDSCRETSPTNHNYRCHTHRHTETGHLFLWSLILRQKSMKDLQGYTKSFTWNNCLREIWLMIEVISDKLSFIYLLILSSFFVIDCVSLKISRTEPLVNSEWGWFGQT